ncbi:MAG TPA: radical SAM family heme chaperone HemW [Candidatus Deferrimicrobium sp.]|nr:radical SAM family heme chaperone HemW [Candidatus Deferrimicrobium sp.]
MPLGLYVHFPFCRNACSYCDFYKELHAADAESSFYAALKRETTLAADELEVYDREISTIFIGGGTPSLTNVPLLSDWLQQLKKHFAVPSGIEFTIECNPESVTLESLRAFMELGINRPIFGIQSFDPRLLGLLHRRHDPHQSHRSVYYANALGFRNFGVDLIFGLPGQTSKMLSADLDQLVDLEPPHISFYQLTVEAGTPLAAMVASGAVKPPDPELAMAMYRGGCERLAEAGYRRYEVSSFARPGFECRHNLRYWEGGDYLGLGPSAHSFIDGRRFANVSNIEKYMTLLDGDTLPRIADESGIEHRMYEAIMLGLRTSRGISRADFSERFGVPVEARLNREQYCLLIESGHLLPDGKSLRLSDEGILVANEITRRLID